MRPFKLSQQVIDRAQVRADKLPLLNNSIRKGEGALVAYIGEEVAKHVLGGEIKDTYQNCDEYAFVSVMKDLSYAWYLGKIDKATFYQKAKFYKEGDYDPESPRTKSFYFKADCYNLPVSQLNG